MTEISKEILDKIIELARLDPLAPGMAHQKVHVAKILDHFSVLRDVNIDGMEPMSNISGAELSLRDDEVDDTFTSEEALTNARLKLNDYLLVPGVLQRDEKEEPVGS